MADWVRFWDRRSWEAWRTDRARWVPYVQTRREQEGRISDLERQTRDAEGAIGQLTDKLSWAEQIGPRQLPIRVAKTEIGLASIGGVLLQELRRSGTDTVWKPIDIGTLHFTDRRMVLHAGKSVEFRFDDIESVQSGRGWVELAVGRRQRPTRLAGPVDQILLTLQEARLWTPDSPPTQRYAAMLAEGEAHLAELREQMVDHREQLEALPRPSRPISPGWLPAIAAVLLAFGIGRMTNTPTVTAEAPVTTTTTATTTSTMVTTTLTVTTTVVTSATSLVDAGELAVLVSITDGDTVTMELADGRVETVRLIGINAPEPGDCHADESTAALAALLSGSDIRLEPDVTDRDQFDRLLRYMFVGEVMVNEALVRSGDALSHHYPPDTAHQDAIDDAQSEAQAARLGLWAGAACGPAFSDPIEIIAIAYNPVGDDNARLNEEWVAFRNGGEAAIDLTGWSVRDESASHHYRFPQGFELDPERIVVLHTGCGSDDVTHLYWCKSGSAVWNNSGDTVFLLDPNGNIHAFRSYDANTPSATADVIGIAMPFTPTTTVPGSTTTQATATSAGNCSSSYPTVCIPPPPPDLDCGQISYRNFKVVGSDPHRFDADNDGIGCES